jgi:hypothetical protein
MTLQEAAEALALRGLLMESSGTGVVVSQQPPAGSLLRKGLPVRVQLEPPKERR